MTKKHLIYREVNGAKYYLQDIKGNACIWTTDVSMALPFESTRDVEELIEKELHNKNCVMKSVYYS